MYAALLTLDNRNNTADKAVIPSKPITISPVPSLTSGEIIPLPTSKAMLARDAYYQSMRERDSGLDNLFDPTVELPAKDMYVEFLESCIAEYERALYQSEHERVEAERISTIIFMLAVVVCACIAVIGMGGA